MRASTRSISRPLRNRQLAELLARAAEASEGNKQRAFRRAARRALLWPIEAADLVAEGRSLTELVAVGPFVGRQIHEWLREPPAVPDAPPSRRGFISYAEAKEVVAQYPGWEHGLRGDLQMHTTYTDGGGTIGDMVEAAEPLGYEYIALTDHSQQLKIAKGMDEAGFAVQDREIAATNAVLATAGKRLRVLRGIEMNITPDGAGDMDERFLADRDIVLGAFHGQLRKTEDQTERYLKALANRTVDVHAHPRGRIWNFRLGLIADWRRVVERATELDKALEIDAYPDRQDLNVELLRLAAETGCRISIGTDAHTPSELFVVWIGVGAAIMAGLRREQILNYMSADELKAWVSRRRARA
ncbi:MAG TPA: PHP domain-containing protein [Candidatus Saccharimonadales bacterium]|nr:PHP domain-containing protein [Candidatus Saccharimonadales bacterium]